MKKKNKYNIVRTSEWIIANSDAASNRKLRFNSLFDRFQDLALQHFKDLEDEIGIEQDKKYAWTISKLYMRIFRLPSINEKTYLDTWIKKKDGAYFYRDFLLFNESKQILVAASSAYSLTDILTGIGFREFSIPEKPGIFEPEKHAVKTKFEKLHSVDSSDSEIMIRAEYSDLDVKGFVSMSKYLEWIMNLFPRNIHESQNIQEIDINIHDRISNEERVNLKMRRESEKPHVIEQTGNAL